LINGGCYYVIGNNTDLSQRKCAKLTINLINKNLIKFDIDYQDKEKVIQELAGLIQRENRLNQPEDYIKEVLRREELTPTGIGYGIAIPHGKCKAVEVPTVAFGRVRKGVEWDAMDGKPVYMVFLLAVPEEAASNHHLKILAALARKILDENFRSSLLTIEDEEAMLQLLSDVLGSALQ
jgi:fructose-specific phosphotransferase system IIA component